MEASRTVLSDGGKKKINKEKCKRLSQNYTTSDVFHAVKGRRHTSPGNTTINKPLKEMAHRCGKTLMLCR